MVFGGLGGLIFMAIWIGAFVDVLMTPERACRNLPKLAWVFIVLLFSLLGTAAWLLAGRPWGARATVATGARRAGAGAHPARAARPAPLAPDDDQEFLDSLRRRADEQRRRARDEQDRLDGETS